MGYCGCCIYMVFTTDVFFEVAIESWPELDLNPRPLNSVSRSNRLNYQVMSATRAKNQLCTATSISCLLSATFRFGCLPSSVATFI